MVFVLVRSYDYFNNSKSRQGRGIQMADARIPELRSILRELHTVSGFRLSVHDTRFREVAAWPETVCPFCTLIQSTGEGLDRCRENDRKAFRKVSADPHAYLYRCCFGLYEAVAPLYVFGNLVGYLMMGQTIDDSPTARAELMNTAMELGYDEKSVKTAAESVFACEKGKILSCMAILDICAQYITLSNRFFLSPADLSIQIKNHIDTNFAGDLTISTICLRFFCGRTTAMKAFKDKYGCSIGEYIMHVRVEAARGLLLSTDLPVRAVGERCGYPDQNYFCKVFRKNTGMTPTAFREKEVLTGIS